ncbi:hypothetical protein R1flu_026451 [Riccia fluitans]|uniref:Uncharacterized protein n=1 Tax=Riccia fluitans TaxID=41844 RepID=A0ABD1XGQ7_9MARC
MWRADNVIAGVTFVRGHRTLQDEVDRTDIDVYYQSLLHALKASVGTLPNSLLVFDYMRSIFDSYVNPTNDPNVQPLVKGLDADDFSVDKFFGLQDPTSPDDVQASPDFEEDLRTNEHSQIVPVPTFVDLTQYTSSPENEGSEHQGWPWTHDPEAIFHVLKTVFFLIVPIDPDLVMPVIVNIEQQQDGHLCGKHVLQMLASAAMKESDGLDRCFREEGLRYLATLDQIMSFEVVFGMYLCGKMAGPPIIIL